MMKNITYLILISCALLVSCASVPVKHSQVSSPSLAGISDKTTLAQDKVRSVAKVSIKPQADVLNSAITDLDDAQVEIEVKQRMIDRITVDANAAYDRLNYIEPKYAASVGLLWKWRLIAVGALVGGTILGIALGLVFYMGMKTWLKSIPVIGWLISKVIP